MFQKEIGNIMLEAVEDFVVKKIEETKVQAYNEALADVVYNIGDTLTSTQIICINSMKKIG